MNADLPYNHSYKKPQGLPSNTVGMTLSSHFFLKQHQLIFLVGLINIR